MDGRRRLQYPHCFLRGGGGGGGGASSLVLVLRCIS